MVWPFSLPPAISKYGRCEHTIVDRVYDGYKHVIMVNNYDWKELDEFNLWCQLNLCYYLFDRVVYCSYTNRWESNGIAGGDALFILTNNDSTAVIARLRWT